MEISLSLNKKLKPFAIEDKRYKIAYGGRGSSKSWTIARILLLKAMDEPLRVLCTREIQDSIKDSVHKLLKDQISLLGLKGFTVLNDVIRHQNGSEFLFKGLYSNLSKIKSFEGVDICWIEEAESISRLSWEILDPTIRKTHSEIWVSFNPRFADDIMYETFIVNRPKNSIVIKVNWQDNKYFPEELREQKDRMAQNDPDLYMHVWEGELKKNTSEQIFHNKWAIERFRFSPARDHPYYGADWGFSQDPNTLIRCYIADHSRWGDNCLFIEYEANDRPYNEDKRKTSSDLDSLHTFWDTIPSARKYAIQADSARPETISLMNKKGFTVHAAPKWSGSVEDGIAHLRSYDKILIHPRCVNTIHEFKHYNYKIDQKTGQVTNKIIDKYNHHIDAIRYALTPVMKRRSYDYSAII